MVSEGKVDIPESFEDDLSDDCENVVVPIATASPFITIGKRSSVGAGNEITSEIYNGTSESSTGTTVSLIAKLPFHPFPFFKIIIIIIITSCLCSYYVTFGA